MGNTSRHLTKGSQPLTPAQLLFQGFHLTHILNKKHDAGRSTFTLFSIQLGRALLLFPQDDEAVRTMWRVL